MAQENLAPMVDWAYDLALWSFSIIIDLFFREVHPRGSWKIPRRGPVIFVCAPHANQFLDPVILMKVVHAEAKRRIAFLIAEKSMRRRWVGLGARIMGAVPVSRAMDSAKSVKGRIYLPDWEDELLVRGVGTDFEAKGFEKGGLLVLPDVGSGTASAEISDIIGPEELRIKKPFIGSESIAKQLQGKDGVRSEELGTTFKIAPHVDQTKVYKAVTHRLGQGGCVGIFPEGGSHDRTDLLPLKAGVAIMALDALAAHPDNDLKIIPVGMNYFHAHKFRSRAIVEFGSPLEIPQEVVQMYASGQRREAVKSVLDAVYQALVAVTVTSPDYDTLMLIQAVRRLYKPINKKLPLPMVVELNRRLVKGYVEYKDDPRIIHLKSSVNEYNRELRLLGLRDHQVEYARFSIWTVVTTLIYRVAKLLVLILATLPGLVLFSPVFIATKLISIRKAREALAASTVKVQARDVLATWKIMVAVAFAPMCYTAYTILLLYWNYSNRVQGLIPASVPWWVLMIATNILFPSITFAALRFGEVGMDIFKSLRPLTLCLNPASSNTIYRLRRRREELSGEVTDVINQFGPTVYPDFEHARIIADPFKDSSRKPQQHQQQQQQPASPPVSTPPIPSTPRSAAKDYPLMFSSFFPSPTSATFPASHSRSPSSASGFHSPSIPNDATTTNTAPEPQRDPTRPLPRSESFGNLANIGLFASHPHTPRESRSRNHSRAASTSVGGGFGGGTGGVHVNGGMQGLTMTTGMEVGPQRQGPELEELSLKIRAATKERRRARRERERGEGGDGEVGGLEEGSSGDGMPRVNGERRD